MTIFDDINRGFMRIDEEAKSIFSGVELFPNNPNREVRAQELSYDINQLIYSFREEKSHLQDIVDEITKEMIGLYKKNGLEPSHLLKEVPIKFRNLEITVNDFIMPLFKLEKMVKALNDSFLVIEQLGITDLGRALPAFDLKPFIVFDTWVKSIEKDATRVLKLQEYIRDLYNLRSELKIAETIDQKFSNTLMAILSHLYQLQTEKYSEVEITAKIQLLIENALKIMDRDVTGDARSELARRDSYRGSWIREDR